MGFLRISQLYVVNVWARRIVVSLSIARITSLWVEMPIRWSLDIGGFSKRTSVGCLWKTKRFNSMPFSPSYWARSSSLGNELSFTMLESPQIKEIISKEKAASFMNGEADEIMPFLKLRHLELHNLEELDSIHWSPLSFPCLEKIHVFNCPNLWKLPLDSCSARAVTLSFMERKSGSKNFNGTRKILRSGLPWKVERWDFLGFSFVGLWVMWWLDIWKPCRQRYLWLLIHKTSRS